MGRRHSSSSNKSKLDDQLVQKQRRNTVQLNSRAAPLCSVDHVDADGRYERAHFKSGALQTINSHVQRWESAMHDYEQCFDVMCKVQEQSSAGFYDDFLVETMAEVKLGPGSDELSIIAAPMVVQPTEDPVDQLLDSIAEGLASLVQNPQLKVSSI